MISKDLVKDALIKLFLCSEKLAIKVSCPSFRKARLLASDIFNELQTKALKSLLSEIKDSDRWQITYDTSKIDFVPRHGGNSAEYIIEIN